ncbi:uncharacterized protein BCR38DRAFT_351593 [Pseudomassariella vexata]|uniref:Vacuolar ATPase assembly protein VMA22 n=1 Tax=Pseudomassariella vexata TaxID=1141098 RepID=A0A1Y2DJ13_9PEZI|nr:uncharacterized protein BCR38DRAFT_351593 [Pseudomassariella vexata]ORY59223.1 hypothetical protein BCR38DRAFT_351593 [Pseudomassariella vexata]
METERIDSLLEHYLQLLHEYTTLRAELSGLQASVYQNIARANFCAERGMRYGQDYYDDRMQASRRLAIASGDSGAHKFHVCTVEPASQPSGTDVIVSGPERGDSLCEVVNDGGELQHGEQDAKPVKKQKKKDPLHWFGILAPMPLRQAQGQSIKAVEQVIPKLVAINAEMAEVEIEVRRARKRRVKTEAAAQKQQESVTNKEIVA